ncbi:MAG TPA: YciI family protein [Candidatus Limnocylindria bacterium]|jgi:hypothetical protein|nr:YciI family protein [Candidatus Limnocylindria bacterium]
MRFMMIVKANPESEAGAMPEDAMLDAMGRYNEELTKAGVLLDLAGLQPSSKGVRVQFKGDKRSVIDGPFTESKELIAGYWLIQVKSKEEAVAWALRVPNPHGEGAETNIELRPLFELDDLAPSEAVERMRERLHKFDASRQK